MAQGGAKMGTQGLLTVLEKFNNVEVTPKVNLEEIEETVKVEEKKDSAEAPSQKHPSTKKEADLKEFCHHSHYKKVDNHLKRLASGEGINYQMLFVENENKYFDEHIKGATHKVETLKNGASKANVYLGNKVISPWHDIPHMPDEGSVSFVVEIPKYERKKMECYTGLPHNPIMQDVNKDGTPREYFGPIFWNYGFVP
jgi:hypothetical protein